MTLDDIKGFMKEKGLITRARNRDIVLQRHYLAAYMFWTLKMSLTDIGKELNRGHDSIRHNIIEVFYIQDHAEFIEFTEELRSKIPMRFPQYIETSPKETTESSYKIEVLLNQKEFERFIDSNYSHQALIGILFKQFMNYATTNQKRKARSARSIQFPSGRSHDRE
jgi:hypothetical protein